MPRAISPGPAGLKFWRAPGLSADNTDDIGSLPAGIGDQFNPWGPKRPVQDWVWGNLCLYPPSEASTLPAVSGSYALTGSDAALTVASTADTTNLPAGMTGHYVPWGRPYPVSLLTRTGGVLVAAEPVILTAAAGSYTLTGSSAAQAFGHAAGPGSYTFTGSAVALALGHGAGAGSYTITGAAAGLTIPGGLVAAAGSYTLTGTAAILALGHAAGAGSYTITGAAAGLTIPGGLVAAAGSYTLTGSDAALTVSGATVNMPAGMTGGYVPWRRPFPVNLRTSTGRPLAEVTEPVVLTAAAGSYAITGSSAALALRLTANGGSYTVSGTAAVLARGYAAGAGAYAIVGTDAQLVQTGSITLTCGAGSYTLTGGSDVSFIGITPPTVEPGGGYTGSRVGRGRMIRRRKRGELDIPPDLEPPPLSPSPPDLQPPAPGPKPPDLLPPQPGLMADMPMPQRKPLPPAPDDEDEDEIALLLKLLS